MRSFIVALIVLISFSTINAQDKVFDGYDWEKSSDEIKVPIIAGFLSGFTFGAMAGMSVGLHEAVDITKSVGESLDNRKTAKEFSDCSGIIKTNGSGIITFTIKKMNLSDTKSVAYYINEIDSFLKTYPLCRRDDILKGLLPKLATVWFPYSDKIRTYKDVGEECLKSK